MVRRYALSKREKKELMETLHETYPSIELSKDSLVEVLLLDKNSKIIIVDRTPFFIYWEGKWIPHLKYLLRHGAQAFPRVAVDKGAVNPILNGADLMAPGIKAIEGSFRENDIVVVIDSETSRPIMVGRALVDSERVKNMNKGKVVENIHRLNDEFWSIA